MRRKFANMQDMFSLAGVMFMLVLVAVLGGGVWYGYRTLGPVTGTIVSTNYDPHHAVTTMVGKVPVTSYEEMWTAEIDTDGDMDSDRTITINENDFNTFETGDSFTR